MSAPPSKWIKGCLHLRKPVMNASIHGSGRNAASDRWRTAPWSRHAGMPGCLRPLTPTPCNSPATLHRVVFEILAAAVTPHPSSGARPCGRKADRTRVSARIHCNASGLDSRANGALDTIRTCDLHLRRVARYPPELWARTNLHLRAAHGADDIFGIARDTHTTWVWRHRVAPPGREESAGSTGRYTGTSPFEK